MRYYARETNFGLRRFAPATSLKVFFEVDDERVVVNFSSRCEKGSLPTFRDIREGFTRKTERTRDGKRGTRGGGREGIIRTCRAKYKAAVRSRAIVSRERPINPPTITPSLARRG